MGIEALQSCLATLASRQRPQIGQLRGAFDALLNGEADGAQTGAFLMGLEQIGVGVDEVVAGASAMRAAMIRVEVPFETVDVCGTGGDGSHSLNISTAVSFVLAGAGLKVAKHGNRGMSSKSGAGDVLEALGVTLTGDPALQARALEEAGIAFLFAQNHHPAMRHVGPARKALGFKTVFNLLGPLSNPAGASRQLVGVYEPAKAELMGAALAALGCRNAMVICGAGNVDEAVLHGSTSGVILDNGSLHTVSIDPLAEGFQAWPLEALKGGDAVFNAAALTRLLNGEAGAYREVVLLNAALALRASGQAGDLKTLREQAETSIDSGSAKAALLRLVAISAGSNP